MTTNAQQTSALRSDADQLDLRPRSVWRDGWARIRRNRAALACLVVAMLYVLVGLSSFLPVYERKVEGARRGLVWDEVSETEYQPPRLGRPSVLLGTDIQKRSVFWRVAYGTRIALTITVLASLIAISIGVVLGIAAGYFGGWIDAFIVWLFSTVSSVPWVLLVVAMTFVLKPLLGQVEWIERRGLTEWIGLMTVILALGLTDWVGLCRLIRGEVMKLRERDYVVAARAVGLGHTRILLRHILPNVFHLVIIQFSLGAVGYVQAEVVLAFLGLGITEKPSWGRMIDDAKLELLRGVWWQVTAATVAIFVLCLALNLLGDALRDALDPRLRGAD